MQILRVILAGLAGLVAILVPVGKAEQGEKTKPLIIEVPEARRSQAARPTERAKSPRARATEIEEPSVTRRARVIEDVSPAPVRKAKKPQHKPAAEIAALPKPAKAAAPAPVKTAVPAAPGAPSGGASTSTVARVAPPSAPTVPAKVLFAAAPTAAPLAARAIGFYAKGCLSGAKALAIDGPEWQAMRLSRNRNWGHPKLVALVEKLAKDAKAHDGWPGLLVGDLSQPRGGPMLSGHASHQIGLDVDIWLTPMPDRRLTHREREDLPATSMLAADRVSVDPKIWSERHARLILRAASYPEVERVLVHPAIKKALCTDKSLPRTHFNKVRPYWGHHFHMHIRIACPKDSPGCQGQPPVGSEDGCGKEVDDWLSRMKRIAALPPPPPVDPKKPAPKRREIMLNELPAECKAVLASGAAKEPSPVADVTKPAAAPQPTPSAPDRKSASQ